MPNVFQYKIRFTERFKKQYALRLHMSLILLATACSGLLATRLMLAMHMENVLLRYPLAVVVAYIVFFISIKVWLKFIAPDPPAQKATGDSVSSVDLMPDMPVSFPSGQGGTFHGGGGTFDGGGASDSFTDAGDILSGGVDTGKGIGESVGDAVGEIAGGALDDEGGIVAVVVFAVLAAVLAVVVGAGAYLVYEAPFILSEAAFEFMLAAGLLRRTKRMSGEDWIGSVFKTTWLPFTITLAVAVLAGYLMQVHFPGVTRISELFSRF